MERVLIKKEAYQVQLGTDETRATGRGTRYT